MNTLSNTQDLAIKFLKFLGKRKPSQKQIEATQKLLFTAVVQEHLYFDQRLTQREQHCLLLAAKGFTSNETAKILNIKKTTVETYRLNIFKKLSCHGMAQAVMEGIRIGQLPHSFS